MVSIPKVIAVMSCGFVLCVGLTYAAHPSAETDPTTGRGSQAGAGGKADRDTMKGEKMKAGQTAKKGGQAGGKGEKATPKEDEMNSDQSTDKRNDKGQEEKGDKVKGGY